MTNPLSYNFFVPVELCKLALSTNLIFPLRLYCYLKGSCAGKRTINRSDIATIAAELNCHPRTVTAHLTKLQHLNWIGYIPKSKYYLIRGFDKIGSWSSRSGVEFQKSYLDNFKAYTASAYIGYVANLYRRKKGSVERNKGRSNQALPHSGHPVATRLISKLLKISLGKASLLKKEAKSAGFIVVTRSFRDTGVPCYEKKFYKKTFPELAGRVRQMKSRLVIVDTDLILSTLRYKRRRKRERIRKGIRGNCVTVPRIEGRPIKGR